ncbi:HEAT repeat domain-containing protein [Streptomyces kaniharaensis]|uniref:HEAT repeat domain-containing protein n=1 Tax=Streptomyces kaniharaensis TaxID=212423 RepID=A0A6N7L443_9ACTN|nr:HEAT repeat domain-containing protein [Streptomyces kaniharaensis]MQS16974.1 HEAT repeat domain-containing protein [Streptomyces kaniharaensis]
MRRTTTDPLSGLDAIDWAELEHAYGPASDVPEQLRALCGPDEGGRKQALHSFNGNIFHQGSRYPASAVAVPFLARMAADTTLPERAEVLRLLASLAIGYDNAHLPCGVAIAPWRRSHAEFTAKDEATILAEFDAWVAEAADENERQSREFRRTCFEYDEHLEAMNSELGAYDAVRGEVPRLVALLADPDPGVRAATAYLLAWFPEEAPHTLPHLLALLDNAPDGEEAQAAVTATALVTVGLLGDRSLVPRLRPFLTAEDRLPRWAAAVALARLATDDAPAADDAADDPANDPDLTAAVLAELAAAEATPPEPGPPGIAFHDGDLRGYAAVSLTLLADTHPDEALDAVTDGLARTSGVPAFAVTAAALRLAFGTQHGPLPSFPDLDERRQRLIRVLAERDEATWRWMNFVDILRAWGLPQDRPAMRSYAQLSDA